MFYQEIVNELKTRIDSGELGPGEKIPSVSEMRKFHGVSHITAARVYKELSAIHYVEGSRRSGYHVCDPAQREKRLFSFTGNIGNFVRPLRPHMSESIDNFYNEVNYAIQDECYRLQMNLLCGCSTLPLSYPPYSQNILTKIREAMLSMAPQVDGFLADNRIPDEILRPVAEQSGKPLVILDRGTSLPVASVLSPNREGMLQLLNYAFNRGCDRWIFVSGNLLDNYNEGERRTTFFEFMKRKKIPNGMFRCLDHVQVHPESSTYEKFRQMAEVYAGHRIAVLCANDYVARLLLQFSGNIPEDTTAFVSGFGGIDNIYDTSPLLTTVRVKPEDMGRTAVRLLQGLLTSPKRGQALYETVPSSFIPGETM